MIMSQVRLETVSKHYGGEIAVDRVSLTIGEAEFVTLLGASGSGKTTCLRMVAGFVAPTAGRVFIGDADVTGLPPQKRDTAMVFQQYALFPHLNVAQNVAFGLKVRRLPRAEVEARVRAVLDLVQLGAYAERFPNQLSGGQKQRVALARAVVLNPKILLLDEPLGALDLKLREELQVEIKRVQSALGVTTLFVTHDQGEALSMSDRIGVMHRGRIVQIDTPDALYRKPVNGIVARFIGRITLIPARLESTEEGVCRLVNGTGSGLATRSWPADARPGEDLLLSIRPESYRFEAANLNYRPSVVERVIYQGATWLMHAKDEAGIGHIVEFSASGPVPKLGETVPLSWRAEDCRAIRET
jgi:ABC-type Fe3+/spermidine/putrescine transport system ATPase subunit